VGVECDRSLNSLGLWAVEKSLFCAPLLWMPRGGKARRRRCCGPIRRGAARKAENFRSETPSHLQWNLQTPRKSPKKICLQISGLDLLSRLPVVNRFGENCSVENGIWGLCPVGTQQPHFYNLRKQRDFSAERLDGERVRSGDWLGREDSNLRMTVPKTVALPLGDAPSSVLLCGGAARHKVRGRGGEPWRGGRKR
jgi:hypothetical protein